MLRFAASLLILLPLLTGARAGACVFCSRIPGEREQILDAIFDGAPRRGGDPVGLLDVAATPAVAAPDGAVDRKLLAELLSRVELAPNKDPRAQPAVREALENILKSPTGRELAQAFVTENARAKIEFGRIAGSAVVTVNGRKVLAASGGHTDPFDTPPLTTLNRDYLDTDPDYRRVNLAATLAHEMLGHGFQSQRDDAAGVSPVVNYYYRGDEANAGLIGWLVQTELGGPLDDGHMWNYLRDPEIYHRALQNNMAYYAVTFSLAEMKDPVAALKARLDGVAKAREKLAEEADNRRHWRKVLDHFVSAHGADPGSFQSISDDINNFLKHSLKQRGDNLDEIEKNLNDTIVGFSSDKGEALKQALASAADCDTLRANEARLESYRRRLAKLTTGRHRESSAPPVPGQVTWEELVKMWDKDDPAHKANLPR